MSSDVIGGYVRHRDRMIQESVFQDLRDTLIACRWLAGTTSQPVSDPYDPGTVGLVTTSGTQVLKLLENNPVVLIDYFPEAEDEKNRVADPASSKTALNTFALDNGRRGEATPRELGSSAQIVPYLFNMAFYATSDAVAAAVLNDLVDRYAGRLVRDDAIELWDYNTAATAPVVRMDIEGFRYTRNTELATPANVHLYFGELQIVDDVD